MDVLQLIKALDAMKQHIQILQQLYEEERQHFQKIRGFLGLPFEEFISIEQWSNDLAKYVESERTKEKEENKPIRIKVKVSNE